MKLNELLNIAIDGECQWERLMSFFLLEWFDDGHLWFIISFSQYHTLNGSSTNYYWVYFQSTSKKHPKSKFLEFRNNSDLNLELNIFIKLSLHSIWKRESFWLFVTNLKTDFKIEELLKNFEISDLRYYFNALSEKIIKSKL